jgi:TonB family protein
LLVTGRGAAGQVISGRVIDSASRLDTQLVTVLVLGADDRVAVSTRTDTAGIFVAPLPSGGRFRVRVAVDSTTSFDSDIIQVESDEFVEREFGARLLHVYRESEVQKSIQLIEGTFPSPRYPPALLNERMNGEVIVEYVVDSTGRPRPETFRVVRATHPEFTAAVRKALRHARFHPAELGGRHVPQWVQQPFTFAVSR